MAGPECQRNKNQPIITTPSPSENDHNANCGVLSTTVEASKNALVASESDVAKNETNISISDIMSKKRSRGPNRGIKLAKQVEKKGKLDIMIPESINRPVGDNHPKMPREIGFLVRTMATMQVDDWSKVGDEIKKKIVTRLQNKFDLDLTKQHVNEYIETSMKKAWHDFHCKAHLHYKSLDGGEKGREKLYATFLNRQDDWKWLCDYFDSDAFKVKSNMNSKNRACLTTLPRTGLVSLVAYQHEDGYDDIDLYKAEFTDKNGNWMDKEHENKYNEMKSEFEQAIENGVQVTEAAICAKYLGTPSGYIRGKGRGPKPPKKERSSSITTLPSTMNEHMQDEVSKTKEELTQATKKLDETSEELKATKKKFKKQEKMIDCMRDVLVEKFGMTLPILASDEESGDD